MRFLANENFPGDAVAALRSGNHDVAWVRTESPGSTDEDVLARAMRERRVLLTFDKDFGELAWNAGAPGAIVMKSKQRQPKPNEFSRGVGRALRRAARAARKTTRMHGTPIYVMRNGKVVAVEP